MINIAAGVFNVKLYNYIVGTFLGILPGSLIYAWVGSGLGYTLSQGQSINTAIILSPQVLLPIIGLAILSILPIVYQKLKNSPKKVTINKQ